MPLTTIFPLSKHIFHPSTFLVTQHKLHHYIIVQFSRFVEAKMAAHDGGQIRFSPLRGRSVSFCFSSETFSA